MAIVMQVVWLLFTGAVLLAPSVDEPDDRREAARMVLRRVARMEPAAQRQWLLSLEARLDRANRVALAPEAAGRQRARIHNLLRRESVSAAVLLDLLVELDAVEKAAIDRLVRSYRVQTYRTFHRQRPIFNRRRDAWYRVFADWQQAGRPLQQQDRLLVWLESAIRNSQPDMIGPLPAFPNFSPQGEPWRAIVSREPIAGPPQPAAIPPDAEELPTPPIPETPFAPPVAQASPSPPRPPRAWPEHTRPSVPLPRPRQPIAEMAGSSPTTAVALGLITPRKLAEVRGAGREPFGDRADRALPREASRRVEVPSVTPRPALTPVPEEETARRESLSLAGRIEGGRAPETSPAPRQPSDSAAAADDQSALMPSLPTALLREPSAGRPANSVRAAMPAPRQAGSTLIAALASVHGAIPPEAASQSVSEKGATGSLSAGVFEKGATGSLSAGVGRGISRVGTGGQAARGTPNVRNRPSQTHPEGPTAVQPAPVELAALPPASAGLPAVRINLDELAANIAGVNLSLRALEAELDTPGRWNARQLASIVDRLKIIAIRRADLTLFREIVAEGQRVRLGRLASPRAAISRIAARIFEARSHATGPEFTGADAERRAELQRLDELSRRLAALAPHE